MKGFLGSCKSYRGHAKLSAMILILCFVMLMLALGIGLLSGMHVQAENIVDIKGSHRDVEALDVQEPSVTPEVVEPQQEEPEESPWYLILVNKDNSVPEGYSPTLAKVEGNHQVDERIVDVLNNMLKDCRRQGLDPLICSSYRSNEDQISLFQAQVKKKKKQGLSSEKAVAAAETTVAYPGTSEHELGLAVDIVSIKNQVLDKKQEQTKVYQWLKSNCAEYGFIVRYPDGKTDITGIIYEPWHFRYVGVEAAQEIMSKGVTLEEYLCESGKD